ncbi:MAG TPA: hypothetical protein DCQ06_01845 [Myxococcales bacterium]|nr:hypothetical protein [Myxococcales bacterium]
MEVGLLDLEQAVRALIRAALTRGGKDNVTALMLRAETGQGSGTHRALSSSGGLEDTSPGFDVSEGDGAWDLETLPAFETSPLMTGLLEPSGAPNLSNLPQPEAQSEGLDSNGEAIPLPPMAATATPASTGSDSERTASGQDSKGRDIPPPPRVDTRRSSRSRSNRVPAPESPFANKSGGTPRPISGVTNPLDADTDQFGGGQSPGDWPTAPYRAPENPEAESVPDERTATDITDIFRAPTEQVRAIPLPPEKKD